MDAGPATSLAASTYIRCQPGTGRPPVPSCRAQEVGVSAVAESKLDKVINLAKRRGFVFPCGEIYGGTRAAWDYGPLGVELKENIKRQWWHYTVTSRADVVGLDSSVILPSEVWVASGHVGVFNDPLIECLSCHKRFRADELQELYATKKGLDDPDAVACRDRLPQLRQPRFVDRPRDFN